MVHSKPFAWLLAAGMLCSPGGLAVVQMPEASSAVRPDPTPHMSALEAVSHGPANVVPTLVTEAPPDSTAFAAEPTLAAVATPEAATAIAEVIATQTEALPAREGASGRVVVQAVSANVEPPERVRAADKAWGLFEAINEARWVEGLAALEWEASLVEVGYARANHLIEHSYFEHYGPNGESAFSELAARGIGYRLAGENLARNNYTETKTVAAAFQGLMASDGHRANILEERFSSVGVACVRDGMMWVYVMVLLDQESLAVSR